MHTATRKSGTGRANGQSALDELRAKAALFDEMVEIIGDHYLGRLMQKTEKELNISLSEAKKRLA